MDRADAATIENPDTYMRGVPCLALAELRQATPVARPDEPAGAPVRLRSNLQDGIKLAAVRWYCNGRRQSPLVESCTTGRPLSGWTGRLLWS